MPTGNIGSCYSGMWSSNVGQELGLGTWEVPSTSESLRFQTQELLKSQWRLLSLVTTSPSLLVPPDHRVP